MMTVYCYLIYLTLLALSMSAYPCVSVEEGYSNTDGTEHKPNSAFNILEHDDNQNYLVYNDEIEHKLPIIVWWTPTVFPHFDGKSPKYVVQCGNVSCYSTNDKSVAKNLDTRAFIFYGTDLDIEDLPLPRLPHHEWAIFHEESPLNNYLLSHKYFIELFNHTATFRSESDFPLTSQNIYHANFFTVRKAVPVKNKNTAKKKKNLAPVLYVQSHCDVPSDRDRYVKKLMKYIDIDSYGNCLHNKDLPEDLRDPVSNFEKDEFLDFISDYKFHLAFENAMCTDYMTEKLLRTLQVGSIPIYRGSSSAQKWMPNNKSIIMVDDFNSPKELAEFIKNIDNDDVEYETYTEFKRTGVTNAFLIDHLKKRTWHPSEHGGFDFFRGYECFICRKLHERINKERDNKRDPSIPLLPPKMATSEHMGCPEPYPSLGCLDDIPKHDIWYRNTDWIEQYRSDFNKARAVRDMILAKEKNSKQFINYLNKYIRPYRDEH